MINHELLMIPSITQQQPTAVTLLVAEMKATLKAMGIKVDSQAARIVKLEKELAKANERIDLLMEEKDINSKLPAAAAQQLIRPQSVQTQYRTCDEFYSATLRNYQEIGFEDGASIKSGMYWIDVDGQGVGEPPIYVYCNMTDGKLKYLYNNYKFKVTLYCLHQLYNTMNEFNKGTTLIGHDAITNETVTSVTVGKCSSAGCFSREIVYDSASPRQLESLIQMSRQCTQQVKVKYRSFDLNFDVL